MLLASQGLTKYSAQKYAKGKPCKPYNSVLGEFFRVSCGPVYLTKLDS